MSKRTKMQLPKNNPPQPVWRKDGHYESPETHKEWINLNLDIIMASAWKGYQSEGRGALVADVKQGKLPANGNWKAGEQAVSYISDKAVQEKGIGWAGPKETAWIQEYDPEREVIVIFIRRDGGASSYRIGGQPTPPEAYRELAPRLAEWEIKQ